MFPCGQRSKARGKTTTLIGRRCKRGNTFSRPVLIGRGLGFRSLVLALESLGGDTFDNWFPVAIARGSHPFPSRTRKLSLSAPMVLGERSPGRVGRRRFSLRRAPPERAGALRRFRPRRLDLLLAST